MPKQSVKCLLNNKVYYAPGYVHCACFGYRKPLPHHLACFLYRLFLCGVGGKLYRAAHLAINLHRHHSARPGKLCGVVGRPGGSMYRTFVASLVPKLFRNMRGKRCKQAQENLPLLAARAMLLYCIKQYHKLAYGGIKFKHLDIVAYFFNALMQKSF